MNRNHADEYEEADALLNESISEAEPADMPLAGDDELRLARIAEYRHDSLRKDNPLQANLALVNCGLFEFAFYSETAVKNSLQSAGVNILESPVVQRALRLHLNIARQVDRYANLVVRLDEAEQQAENAKAQRRISAMPAPTGPKYGRGRT